MEMTRLLKLHAAVFFLVGIELCGGKTIAKFKKPVPLAASEKAQKTYALATVI